MFDQGKLEDRKARWSTLLHQTTWPGDGRCGYRTHPSPLVTKVHMNWRQTSAVFPPEDSFAEVITQAVRCGIPLPAKVLVFQPTTAPLPVIIKSGHNGSLEGGGAPIDLTHIPTTNEGRREVDDGLREFTWILGTLEEGYGV